MVEYGELDYDSMTEDQLLEVGKRYAEKTKENPTLANYAELEKVNDAYNRLLKLKKKYRLYEFEGSK